LIKIGYTVLFIVLGLSAYLIFWTQVDLTKTMAFAGIGILIAFIFIKNDRITSIKIPFLELKADIDKVRSNAQETEEILKSIKSQKDTIDLIVRDANAAQMRISQIEMIANQAHMKAQETEKDLKDVKSREEEEKTRRELRRMSSTGHRD